MQIEKLQQQLIESEIRGACAAAGITNQKVIDQLHSEAIVIDDDGVPVVSIRMQPGSDLHQLGGTPGSYHPLTVAERLAEIVKDEPQVKPAPKAETVDIDAKIRDGFTPEDFQRLSPQNRMAAARRAGVGPKQVADATAKKATQAQVKAMSEMSPTDRMKYARRHGIA